MSLQDTQPPTLPTEIRLNRPMYEALIVRGNRKEMGLLELGDRVRRVPLIYFADPLSDGCVHRRRQ